MKKYHQLNQREREAIYRHLQDGRKAAEIARILNRHKSTICREITRNRHQIFDEYLPDTAQKKAESRKRNSRKKRYVDRWPELKIIIKQRLLKGWTPSSLAGWLRGHGERYLNPESIYRYIYSPEGREQKIYLYLPQRHRLRHRESGRKHFRGQIPGRLSIHFREASALNRQEYGHWEGDTIYYPGGAVLSCQTERKTRYLCLSKCRNKEAKIHTQTIIRAMSLWPKAAIKTLTVDNGLEFAGHQTITAQTETRVYFTDPGAPYQKPTVENTIRLVRRFLPKGLDLSKISSRSIKKVEKMINDIPKKCLGYLTPKEAFEIELAKLKPYPNGCT